MDVLVHFITQFFIYIFPLFLYSIYGLLHDFPGFSLQSSEAPEADLDAGQTTGESDTGGEREAGSEGPEDGSEVEGTYFCNGGKLGNSKV